MSRSISVAEICKGKWPAILTELGIDQKFLSGSHVSCPICGGRDRFRFDDLEGRGTFICSKCGAGDGFTLLQKINGWSFSEAKERVLAIAPSARKAHVYKRSDEDTLRKMIDGLWTSGLPVKKGDPASMYLRSRGIEYIPQEVRFLDRCRYQERGQEAFYVPAMLARVSDAQGNMVNVHRTYITMDGRRADVPDFRKMMSGRVPDGSAIRLWPAGSKLGVAEGIETAVSAAILFKMPVWSCINARGVMVFDPPKEVSELVIFGDNDTSFTGQSAAYALANRLKLQVSGPRIVRVEIPERSGEDWNDVLKRKGAK